MQVILTPAHIGSPCSAHHLPAALALPPATCSGRGQVPCHTLPPPLLVRVLQSIDQATPATSMMPSTALRSCQRRAPQWTLAVAQDRHVRRRVGWVGRRLELGVSDAQVHGAGVW